MESTKECIGRMGRMDGEGRTGGGRCWAVKWGEDEEVLGYNSEVLGSNQKYLEILRSTWMCLDRIKKYWGTTRKYLEVLRSTWKCLDSGQSSEEKMRKYLGTTRKYMEVLGSIWTVQ